MPILWEALLSHRWRVLPELVAEGRTVRPDAGNDSPGRAVIAASVAQEGQHGENAVVIVRGVIQPESRTTGLGWSLAVEQPADQLLGEQVGYWFAADQHPVEDGARVHVEQQLSVEVRW
jgi:hypothetical protein